MPVSLVLYWPVAGALCPPEYSCLRRTQDDVVQTAFQMHAEIARHKREAFSTRNDVLPGRP